MKVIHTSPWQPVAVPGGRKRTVQYSAAFWQGPERAGDIGRHVARRCDDVLYERDGCYRFLNTSRSVSYFDDLLREARK